jgi:Fe-S-cluster-containing dehydrogenase component
MADKKEEPKLITRRQFLIGGGAVVATAVALGVAACTQKPGASNGKTTPTPDYQTTAFTLAPVTDVIGAGVIKHDPVKCTGCGTCVQMCSTNNAGEPGPLLARNELVSDPFEAQFTFNSCQQCETPMCYFACPKKDVALCIDPATGTRYTNEAECIGCGKCVAACIYRPSRRKINPEKNVAINCNLCRGRAEGPTCVQYCNFGALQLIPAEQR